MRMFMHEVCEYVTIHNFTLYLLVRSLFRCHVDLILESSASKFCLSSFNCNRKRMFVSEVHQVTC